LDVSAKCVVLPGETKEGKAVNQKMENKIIQKREEYEKI
jgi:hypothetical protein